MMWGLFQDFCYCSNQAFKVICDLDISSLAPRTFLELFSGSPPLAKVKVNDSTVVQKILSNLESGQYELRTMPFPKYRFLIKCSNLFPKHFYTD